MKTSIAYSTKANGSMKRIDGTVDLENIQKFLQSQSMPTTVFAMEQVHSGSVAIILSNSEKITHGVDSLLTSEKGVSLAVVTADCLPIIMYDPDAGAIGVIHAGSKGLLQQIISNTMSRFIDTFNSKPEDIVVCVGPSIERNCYEVGQELLEQFEKEFGWFNSNYYTNGKDDHYFLDLKKTAQQCLRKEGILEKNISISDICTKCCVDTYYSYRRGDKTDRFVSVISFK